MLGFDLDDLLQVWLIEVFSGILEDILRLFLQNLIEEDGDHVLQFGMLAQVGLIVDPILHFFLVEQAHLRRSEPLDASHVMRVVVLLLVIHVRYLVVVDLLLLVVLTHSNKCFKNIKRTTPFHPYPLQKIKSQRWKRVDRWDI